ncbi:MAG: TraC family protein [Desulforegulaceae bacterium]|nr:TraC family protein [Desulforegulaceae bacterium]
MFFFNSSKTLSFKDLFNMKNINKISKYLPYRAYDPDRELYYNVDDSIGIMFECTPLVFASKKVFDTLEGLFNIGIPFDSSLQFLLYADPNIDYVTDLYLKMKTRKHVVVQKQASATVDFLKDQKGFRKKMKGIPPRDHRLFVSLKIPYNASLTDKDFEELKSNMKEILNAAFLNPVPIKPLGLIAFLGQILNDKKITFPRYDDFKTINEQIVLSDSDYKFEKDRLVIGNKILRSQTVKNMPKKLDSLTANLLTGGIEGLISDAQQITIPYFFSTTIIFKNIRSKIHAKCNIMLKQKGLGSLSIQLKKKTDEYMWAADQLEEGKAFYYVIPSVWTIADDEEKSLAAAARLKRLWESQGFTVQNDKLILQPLFLTCLPFGLYNEKNFLDFLNRHQILQSEAALRLLPIQADFNCLMEPAMLFSGRKGQIVSLNIFNKHATNYNAFVAAESGAGKSFFMNTFCINYFGTGAKIRLVDVGGSYKKLCEMLGGKYIVFSKENKIVLNPISNIRDPDEDIHTVAAIIAQMAYSASLARPSEEEMTLIKEAVKIVYTEKGNDGNIDDVYNILLSPSKKIGILQEIIENCVGESCSADLNIISTRIAFNLAAFTSRGEYGGWFNGPSTFNIAHDDFVVLELQELKNIKELFPVIILQLMNAITSNLYLSERDVPRIVGFDEAWECFSEESYMLEQVIEAGYRKARKYQGSFITITQSVMDLKDFGKVGRVINDNSAFKFLLQAQTYQKIKDEKMLDISDFDLHQLESVKNNKPHYSEIYLQSALAKGVFRLCVDPTSYYIYSTEATDKTKLEKIMAEFGCDIMEAIEILVERDKNAA